MTVAVEGENEVFHDELTNNVDKISTFRRLLPQILVAIIKNLIIVLKNMFEALLSIVIPSLLALGSDRDPDEVIRMTPEQSSWLSSLAFIGHPLGSLLSGVVSDALGRRKAMMLTVASTVIGFTLLGFAESYAIVGLAFLILSFVFGLKDAPSAVYICETSEPSIRVTLLSITTVSISLGTFIIFVLGSFFQWRQVSLICAAVPVFTVAAIYFVPESPSWLLSKDRPKDAQKSLQWLRGWVPSEKVRDELQMLQNHSFISNSCIPCAKQSIRCYHPKATFCDKIKELKRKRSLKPVILVIALDIFRESCGVIIWKPYIKQVLEAYGMPLDTNLTTVILGAISIVANCCFLVCVKTIGKRKLYIASTAVVVICHIGLSVYGWVFFPPNWTSFENSSSSTTTNFERMRGIVGNYGYLALILMSIIHFGTGLGLSAVPFSFEAELFPYKLRSFLCGIAVAARYIFASFAAKTYYNIEMWLSLSGATLFYGLGSLIGLIAMYFILPETENRSLEDIELHYSDNKKKITDIHICMNGQNQTTE